MNNQEYKQMLIERSYRFAVTTMRLIDNVDYRDFSIKIIANQLLRSATSIGANITEAQAASSRKDFANFLQYALKSSNEAKYWLRLFRDSGKTKKEQIDILLKEVTELSNLLASSILSIKGKKLLTPNCNF
ncbi:four helix bundle protein [Candidatus Peregrinibacteria bacterium]|nr:four helix bundle protein [Candidatus Peregrinibacteria bacterium]